MWIRSQDKRKLVKVNYVGISEECKREIVIMNEYDGFVAGRYETEERTLTVMGYIQNKITKGEKAYSMPEE